jgi:DegV family protein with EDD domain
MIHILTDSCSDLSPELLERYRIDVIRLSVFINNHTYADGLDIDRQTLFSLVAKTGQLPLTSAPSVAEFQRFFDRDGEIIYITGIGSPLSATFSNALLARKALPQRSIRIIDSLNLSTGSGLLVVRAAEMRDEGCPPEEIEAEIRDLVPRVHTSMVLETLEYLYKGGRCNAVQLIVGSLLKIRPIIEVRADGSLGIRAKIRGSRQKALETLLADTREHLSQLDLRRVFVSHTGCDADAAYLMDALRSLAPFEQVLTTYAGSTISSHCGPDTIGILYITK